MRSPHWMPFPEEAGVLAVQEGRGSPSAAEFILGADACCAQGLSPSVTVAARQGLSVLKETPRPGPCSTGACRPGSGPVGRSERVDMESLVPNPQDESTDNEPSGGCEGAEYSCAPHSAITEVAARSQLGQGHRDHAASAPAETRPSGSPWGCPRGRPVICPVARGHCFPVTDAAIASALPSRPPCAAALSAACPAPVFS